MRCATNEQLGLQQIEVMEFGLDPADFAMRTYGGPKFKLRHYFR